MEKIIKILVIGLVIGIVVLAVLWVFYGTNIYGANITCDVYAIQGRQINNLIEQANYCTVDSDCVISREFQCFQYFGGYNLFNKNADLTTIRKNIEKYYNNCKCMYKSRVPPAQEEVICDNNKCVDTRLKA